MTVALKIRICHLFSEFLAYAFVVLSPFKTARTVSALGFKSVLDGFYNLCIFVKSYLAQDSTPFLYILPRNKVVVNISFDIEFFLP